MALRNDNFHQRGGIASGMVKFLFTILLLAIIVGVAGVMFLNHEFQKPGPLSEEKIVLIKSGMGSQSIADLLQEEGVIRSDILFRVVVRVHGLDAQLQAGEYRVPAGASLQDVIDQLVDGQSILHKLTIPEGRTTKQVLALVASDPILVGDITRTPAEGELLPETYAFTRGETRDMVIERMEQAHTKTLEVLWQGRADNLPFSTKQEAVILASIVEKETGVAEERPQVASVFINRLRKNMRLQSDPTIIYGLTGGEPLGRGLRVSELRRETPYNTYLVSGLPPTPIANPGAASLAAVLNPADTDYLYFVADGTGGHVFATTLAEHNRNVAKWRRIEDGRAQ